MKDKILIVEDDLSNGLAALIAMEQLGLESEVVSNAEEAIKKIEAESYLVVLSDMNMPLKNGESINPKAGETVVNACAKKLIPCFVITAGYSDHSKSNFVHILATYNFFDDRTTDSLVEIGNITGYKDADNWKRVWKDYIEKIWNPVLEARRRYIKYVLSK